MISNENTIESIVYPNWLPFNGIAEDIGDKYILAVVALALVLCVFAAVVEVQGASA